MGERDPGLGILREWLDDQTILGAMPDPSRIGASPALDEIE
jgi:hypothetical protein